MKKIGIIGLIHEDGLILLKNMGFDVFKINDFEEDNLINELKEIDGVILRTAKLSNNVLEKSKKLKIIARHGVGYDNVDIDYLNNNKIALGITGTSNAVSVAEHVMTMFLYLTKKINRSDTLVKAGNFKNKSSLPDFFEMYKKNVLILGFGRIGQSLARRCQGFESNVYVCDPFVDNNIIEQKSCKKIDLEDGIKLADFISIHIPINKDTKNLIGKKQFSEMKNNCVLVNTSRGGIINEKDLLWALENNKIFGAGLDVFETEPPDNNHPFFKLDNILLTPHNAALTLECRKRMSVECAENIVYFFNNDKKLNINNIVNRKILNL
tara:strand:+ start:971 stop:1942 length:972 start_codon:yes stop_codon:yes gene_type:complete